MQAGTELVPGCRLERKEYLGAGWNKKSTWVQAGTERVPGCRLERDILEVNIRKCGKLRPVRKIREGGGVGGRRRREHSEVEKD